MNCSSKTGFWLQFPSGRERQTSRKSLSLGYLQSCHGRWRVISDEDVLPSSWVHVSSVYALLSQAHLLNFLFQGSPTVLPSHRKLLELLHIFCFPLSPKRKLWSRIITEKTTVKRVSRERADSVSLFDRPQTTLRQKAETKCRYIIRGWCTFSLYHACNYTISAKITDAAIKTCILIWEHKNN